MLPLQSDSNQAGGIPMSSNLVIWQEGSFKIYSLSDPETGLVRYVGLTQRSLKERLGEHLGLGCKFHKGKWIKSLERKGLLPVITLEEDNLMKEEALLRETEFILLYKSVGAKLTNHTNGGEGCFGYKHTEESKKKIKIKRSIQTMRKGWNHTEDTKQKISAVNKGKIRSSELRSKISQKLKGRIFSEEHLLKLKEAWKVRKLNSNKIS